MRLLASDGFATARRLVNGTAKCVAYQVYIATAEMYLKAALCRLQAGSDRRLPRS